MEVEENTIVTLSYKLHEQDAQGMLLEVMDIAYPFIFFYKSTQILDAFQAPLLGLHKGDAFAFTIPCNKAYGERKSSEIMKVPVEHFLADQEMGESIQDVGQFIVLTDDDGKQHHGLIVEKTPLYLTVDFNHAMAGKDLFFQGTVLNVRKATPDELVQKRYIMPNGIRFE